MSVERTAERSTHWLLSAAQDAGLPGVEARVVPPGVPVATVWEKVCSKSGTNDGELARLVAAHFRLPVADLTTAESGALKLLPEEIARRFLVYPLRQDDHHIVVATSDPRDLEAEQLLGFASGRTPVFEVAPPKDLREAIDARYSPERMVESLLSSVDAETAVAVREVEEAPAEVVAADEARATPVIKLTNLILRDAVSRRASDIHIEPGRAGGSVRFRVDGVLRNYMKMPMPVINRIISRIKIISKLDIADRLRPQDGRAAIRVEARNIDLRVSTVPTREAEKAVIRILEPETGLTLERIGIAPHDLAGLRRLLSQRDGIVVVTGPTGSGKTTTLYGAIRQLATGEVNIMSVEDPVEYEMPGITQMQVDTGRGVTFASALRAILRQDPDVIFIGEIRDLETAKIAVQASLTEHLVLASLHTNDAVGVVGRLRDLGLDLPSVAECLRGALAQRLVRRVCQICGDPNTNPDGGPDSSSASATTDGSGTVPAGCDECGKTGYRGRVPVTELVVSTPEIQELIAQGASAPELQRAATAAGMVPMRDAAMCLVQAGTTTEQEIERALGDAPEPNAPPSDDSRVLLVDDDAVNRRVARTLLEKNGFDVTEAEDGQSGLDRILGPDAYDLVILDLEMPRLNGHQVLKNLRGSVGTAGLPVIVLTGSEDCDPEFSEVRLMDVGADDYIRKPIDPPRFLARVKATLRRAGGRALSVTPDNRRGA